MRDAITPTQGLTVWFTGLSGAGKTTLCHALAPHLRAFSYRVMIVDADDVRREHGRNLGFSKADRDENVARIGCIARTLVGEGSIVLVAAISPYRQARAKVRAQIDSVRPGSFLEVHVDAPLELCIRRDPKGLYARALMGELPNFTGIDDPYEPPVAPEVHCDTARESLPQCVSRVLAAIHEEMYARLHLLKRMAGKPINAAPADQ